MFLYFDWGGGPQLGSPLQGKAITAFFTPFLICYSLMALPPKATGLQSKQTNQKPVDLQCVSDFKDCGKHLTWDTSAIISVLISDK